MQEDWGCLWRRLPGYAKELAFVLGNKSIRKSQIIAEKDVPLVPGALYVHIRNCSYWDGSV